VRNRKGKRYIGKSRGFTRAFYETGGGCGVARRAGDVGERGKVLREITVSYDSNI